MLLMELYGRMRFLIITVFMLVKQLVNIYEMVCDKVQYCHVFIFRCFAMLIHFWQTGNDRKISLR